MEKWYKKLGKEADIVISTRVRLARNLHDYPFAGQMTQAQRQAVCKLVKDAIFDGHSAISGEFEYIDMQNINDMQAVSLVERHIISPDFAHNRQGRGLLLMKDESVSIMLCEEDHIRIQVIGEGLDLEKAFDTADRIDTLLSERLAFAFDEKLGYLTACPTNLGTAMRASVMMHLPCSQSNGSIRSLAANLPKIGLTLRGIYGEGTEPQGAMYQLSNQITLGINERTALDNLRSVALQFCQMERAARETQAKDESVQDQIWRAYGLLKSARVLSGEEFTSLISSVRLGVTAGILPETELKTVNELFISAQPATLMTDAGKVMPSAERDRFRAEMVRKKLARHELT